MFCYALSPNDGTEWRQRIQNEAEHFIDVSAMTSDVIAKLINEDKIQILINLNGYTKVWYTFHFLNLIQPPALQLCVLITRVLCVIYAFYSSGFRCF